MPRFALRLNDEQYEQLTSREEAPPETLPYFDFNDPAGPVYLDPTGDLDRVILRSLGTAMALEAHQLRGGSVLLGYPDGSLRELRVDLSRDGVDVPPPKESRRWAARWTGRAQVDDGMASDDCLSHGHRVNQ